MVLAFSSLFIFRCVTHLCCNNFIQLFSINENVQQDYRTYKSATQQQLGYILSSAT